MTKLQLAHGFTFNDLYQTDGLIRIDGVFMAELEKADGELFARINSARKNPDALDAKLEADLLLELSPHVDGFIATLFNIEDEVAELKKQHLLLDPIYSCKRLFVQRRALKGKSIDDASAINGLMLAKELDKLIGGDFNELVFAEKVMAWLEDEDTNKDAIAKAADYALWATLTPEGRALHKDHVLFNQPQKLDADNLVKTDTVEITPGVNALNFAPERIHYRDGFKLSDKGCDLTGALDEINYCVICHDRGKDSCSKGLLDKKTDTFSKNDAGIDLTGCPLEERISEMHQAKKEGHAVASLALIAVDNPLCAGTGHRICNDCMKSCIYQKQEPVNIPEVETRALKDILGLSWGFEIYSLLTRWNPMNIRRPVPKLGSGYKVLVVGTGPAGSALAHHLMNDGHSVVAIDGAKLEPMDAAVSGTTPFGERVQFDPIENVKDICEQLDERILAGFGGVAEYGITVRWDKNFLKLERLLLERREQFRMFGGVRFGAQITKQQAFAMGFDHIALCMGAGKPTILGIENNLAPGVRQASDFLMALQLTGAAKSDNIANLQLRLPAVIIGGGLTAIDTATESLAYYVAQCEKFIARFEELSAVLGEDVLRANWTAEDHEIASEFLSHGQAIRIERARAKSENRDPDLATMLNKWGGATIVYRRRMTDSPSYTLNVEEIEKAFEQGIRFVELLSPVGIDVDEFGWVGRVKFERQEIGENGKLIATADVVTLPARAVLVAAGTQPNTVLAREDETFAAMDGKYFRAVDENGNQVTPERSDKPEKVEVMIDIETDGRAVSFFGDLHPSFAGNVVKAMASAKQGYVKISSQLQKVSPTSTGFDDIAENMKQGLVASVVSVNRLTPTIVEVVIKAPMAAAAFKPGQFFRLQNFEAMADINHGTRMAMEGLALTGAEADIAAGTVSLIVLEMGGSSNLCAGLAPGEPVILMGPTGTPTETPGGETVLLAGGGLGNAVLFSIGQAFRAAGSKVLYFAAYKKTEDRYHTEKIEAAADTIIWCSDQDPGFSPGRDGDKAFVGNIVEAMAAYGNGELFDGPNPTGPIDLGDVDRIIAIGSDMMMKAVTEARHGILKDFLKDSHQGIGSINSPMQCMMKEICAQCLQRHVDPETGEEKVVFSCFNQDQPLDLVDFGSLKGRLRQNSVSEKLTACWITHCQSKA